MQWKNGKVYVYLTNYPGDFHMMNTDKEVSQEN